MACRRAADRSARSDRRRAPQVLGLEPLLPVPFSASAMVCSRACPANDLRRAGLAARGYRLVEVVAAPSGAQAVIRYAEAVTPAPAQQPAPAAVAARARRTLGLDPDPGFWS